MDWVVIGPTWQWYVEPTEPNLRLILQSSRRYFESMTFFLSYMFIQFSPLWMQKHGPQTWVRLRWLEHAISGRDNPHLAARSGDIPLQGQDLHHFNAF